MSSYNRLITLPRKGRLLIFTDVHGNLEDYRKYLSKWDSDNPDCHILIDGDFIHSIYVDDYSIEILEDMIEKYYSYDNFHVILGNHEWAHITKANVFKANVNQRRDFEKMLAKKRGSLEPLDDYVKFFKDLPFFLQTDSGIFVSHAGPSQKIEIFDDYELILEEEDYFNEYVFSMLWSRPKKDYDEYNVSLFLDLVGSNVMVVGHTVVDGYEVYGKQMILSSSFGTDNKMYLDIDLTKDVNDMEDLKSFLKNLDK